MASEPTSLNDLPVEILLKILSYIGPEDLYFNVTKVCEKLNVLAKDTILWKTLSYHCDRSSDISRIAEVLTAAPALHSLIVRQRTDAAHILQFLTHKHVDLRKLFLEHCPFMQDDIGLINNIIALYPDLESLSLEGCCPCSSCSYTLIPHLKNLSELNLSNCQDARKLSIERCIQSLVHACQCRDADCRLQSCRKMKRVVQHTKICKLKTNGGCPICKQLTALCCYHATHCQEIPCLVPYCLNVKHKLRLQQFQQRLEQAQLIRRRMAAMNTRPTVPSGALPGNSTTGGPEGVLAGGTVDQTGVMSGQPGAGNMVSLQTPHQPVGSKLGTQTPPANVLQVVKQIITEKESDPEKEDSVMELETRRNYSEDNAHEVEKEDDNLTAIVVDSVESDKKVEKEKEKQKKMKRNRAMKRPIASGLQDVNSPIEKLRKISDDCKTQED